MGALAMLPLVGLLSLTGNHGAMAASLEEKLAATGTAEDHLAAARYYQNEARELDAEAAKFETAVSKIGRYEDTKGFRRAALTDAAQEGAVYAAHFKQSQSVQGKSLPK